MRSMLFIRLFVPIKLDSRCRTTVAFNIASVTLLGAQIYLLCRFLITKFGILQLMILENVLNDSDSINQGIIICLKIIFCS